VAWLFKNPGVGINMRIKQTSINFYVVDFESDVTAGITKELA